jgi:hypothetical protein
MKALRETYTSKKKDVPPGFKPKITVQEADEDDTKADPETSEAAHEEDKPTSGMSEKSAAEDRAEESKVPQDSSQDTTMTDGPASQLKRSGSVERVVAQDQEAPSQKQGTPLKAVKKKFSLGSLMRPTSSAPKSATKNVAVKLSSSGQASRNQKMPAWISGGTIAEIQSDENRSFALEFLQQAAPFVPHTRYVNHDAIARALEAAIYEWSTSTHGRSKDWVDKYWEKVHDLVASISGKRRVGTIATLIAEGKFKSPDEIVRLSDDAIMSSFEGRTLVGLL